MNPYRLLAFLTTAAGHHKYLVPQSLETSLADFGPFIT